MRQETLRYNNSAEEEAVSLINIKKKMGAVVAAAAVGFGTLSGCSSEGSEGGGSSFAIGDVLSVGVGNSSSEVLSGAECAERDDIYAVGTYSAGMYETLVPYESRDQMLSSVALPDGATGGGSNQYEGTLLNMDALPEEFKDAIWKSYNEGLDDPALEKNDKQLGRVILYGDDGKIDQYMKYQELESLSDGELDGDLKVCTFNVRQGSIDKSQLVYNQRLASGRN